MPFWLVPIVGNSGVDIAAKAEESNCSYVVVVDGLSSCSNGFGNTCFRTSSHTEDTFVPTSALRYASVAYRAWEFLGRELRVQT